MYYIFRGTNSFFYYFRFVVQCVAGPGKRQTLRKAEYPRMESKLHSWFESLRNRHVPVSSEFLAAKAKEFYARLYGNENFHASRGWIANFRKRYGIRRLKICGEQLSNDSAAVKPFIAKLDHTIKLLGLQPSQIYNADESALFWKMLPDSTLVGSKEKTAPGRKTSKERITFLASCNSDGSHKLKLLVIGKSKNPRAFRNAELPVDYKATAKAWMTSAVFKQWFDQCFVPQVRKYLRVSKIPEKALLLIDNASSHCSEEELISDDGCIIAMFLPPNTTALIQPMDQNAIRLTKLFYRKSLLAEILTNNEKDLVKCLKSLNIKFAVCLLHNAWEKVPASSLKKCWDKILLTRSEVADEDDPDDLIPLSDLKQKLQPFVTEEIDEVSKMLQNIGSKDVDVGEAVDWIDGDVQLLQADDLIESNDESDEDVPEMTSAYKIKNRDAIKHLNVVLQWATDNNLPLADIITLQRLKEIAYENEHRSSQQAKITNFFQSVQKNLNGPNQKEDETERVEIHESDSEIVD